jgi:L-lactate utilization protein LutC
MLESIQRTFRGGGRGSPLSCSRPRARMPAPVALTLLPDLHVCVVREDQIVETVPELLRRLERAATEGRPLVLVSDPSATSDIELQRVEGVQGPRRLVVIVESC